MMGFILHAHFFNINNIIIDRQNIPMMGEEWQEWPSYETSQEDYKYVKNYCLEYLNLIEFPNDPEPPSPELP